jgi:O-antigen/teichoic acid export membrane protein
LFRLENFILLLLPLFFISIWSPLIDGFTDGKYGQVNESKFWVLALCVPMHGLINFLWTSAFVQGQLKRIMYITISASLINLLANLFLIPLFGGMGAALAFLGSTAVQLVLYIFFSGPSALRMNYLPALYLCAFGLLGLVINAWVAPPLLLRPVLVLFIYTGLAIVTRTVNLKVSLQTLRGRT